MHFVFEFNISFFFQVNFVLMNVVTNEDGIFGYY